MAAALIGSDDKTRHRTFMRFDPRQACALLYRMFCVEARMARVRDDAGVHTRVRVVAVGPG